VKQFIDGFMVNKKGKLTRAVHKHIGTTVEKKGKISERRGVLITELARAVIEPAFPIIHMQYR
jgi:hypothetical protein